VPAGCPQHGPVGICGACLDLATYLAAARGAMTKRLPTVVSHWISFGYLGDVCLPPIRQLDAGGCGANLRQLGDGLPAIVPTGGNRTNQKNCPRSCARPGAKIIGFPRAATQSGMKAMSATGVDALSLTRKPMRWAADRLGCVARKSDPMS